MQSSPGDLGWVDDASLDHVNELVGCGVVAVVAFEFENFLADDSAVFASVVSDLRNRSTTGSQDDVVPDVFVVAELASFDCT